MAKKREPKTAEVKLREQNPISRRDFVKAGAAAGLGAAVLSAPGKAQAQQSAADIQWDHEADIVVCGSGAVGLVAAIRARDLGATVLVVDANFDVGGKMIHSGGWISHGGGDATQERDRLGADPDGMGLGPSVVPPEDLEDDPDRLFTDMTDWSVVNSAALATYRLNEPELHRAWANNTVPTRQLMLDNYVRFARIDGTHDGGGMTRARAARAIMKLAEVTDIRAGTVSYEDAGSTEEERNSPFSAMTTPAQSAAAYGAPGWVQGGVHAGRPLEFSAREKGIKFMLNRHMDEFIREQQFSGRVIGIKASYSPRFNPGTGERLESFWQNGNVDERAETVYIRARRAVIIGTGGHIGNPVFRSMFDPRWREPSIQYGQSLVGPRGNDASGIIAAMKIGANLAGMMQLYQNQDGSIRIRPLLACQDIRDSLFPGHPAFLFVRAKGFDIGRPGFEHVIGVNQVGKRFYNESLYPTSDNAAAQYPSGNEGTNDPFTPLDWRNCSIEHIRATYSRGSGPDAGLAINEGSEPPHYLSGPLWAIFDTAAAERGGWKLRYPYIADPPDGFFFKADTLAELARLVMDNRFQNMPLKYLEETVARYNELADKGTDDDFEKPVMHKIDKPPFYAASLPWLVNDSYGGLRINGKAQVLDLQDEVIPGLYGGGDAVGGGTLHGIGRASVHGYIAATNAVDGPV